MGEIVDVVVDVDVDVVDVVVDVDVDVVVDVDSMDYVSVTGNV